MFLPRLVNEDTLVTVGKIIGEELENLPRGWDLIKALPYNKTFYRGMAVETQVS